MKLYGYWRSSAAYRVRIALNLKDLAVEHISVHLVNNGGEQHRQAFKQLNPQALVPALIDANDQHHHCITQSMAIIEYLNEQYPRTPLLPQDAYSRAIVRSMAQILACEVHPLDNLRVLQYLVGEMDVTQDNKMRWYHHWIHQGFAALEALLQQHSGQYCFGDNVSLADLCLVPQVYNAKRFNVDLSAYPNIVRVDNACMQLPAFQQASPEMQPDAN
ncbi:maleylacetoacetate isomerase [Shewanella intestini]|uniref:Maleylacetoacetate isomerase n=1 Tax=Shewanella intestini TaxID=2017544 RepID=A0ABS5I0E0_9GAMM|nr:MULTISPECIES: maleylacetoacetate isomerase [Shewanella]MBR9726850.1 maleylacetoacetate isomerase [Shewanella intestini]MRG34584.1 maleylacetoacetate isomerase [Shewanella sp. XMDDZSB0408]